VADWSGFYVGGNLGGLFNQSDTIDHVKVANGTGGGGGGITTTGGGGGGGGGGGSAALATFADDSSLLGGVHAGVNWQRTQWVWGLEGDIDFSQDPYQYVASLRGRLGYASDQTLFYAGAGVAAAKNDGFSGRVAVGGGADGGAGVGSSGGAGGAGSTAFVTGRNGDDTDIGLVLASGVDVKVSDRVSIGMEGLYYFFGQGDTASFLDPETGRPIGGLEDDNQFLVARARLTIHLGQTNESLK
jgi:hypothetical protein